MRLQKQGLTLIEVLIALSIFSFAALYISRTVSHLLKRQKKTEAHIKDQRSHSNVLEILKQDLQGVWIHLDMNHYLNRFALSELSTVEENRQGTSLREYRSDSFRINHKSLTERGHFIDPQFDFFGEEDHLTFTALIPSAGDRESERLVKVSYFSKQCLDRETGETGSCLIRGVSRQWKDRTDSEHQKNRVLIRGLKGVTFAYYHPEKKEWERTWKFLSLWKERETRLRQKIVLLPPSVQIKMEWENDSFSYTLPVSHPFLRTFRPANLSPLVYLQFPTEKSSTDKDRGTGSPDPSTDQTPVPSPSPRAPPESSGRSMPPDPPVSIPQPPAYQ